MLGRNVTLAGTRFYDEPGMYRKIRYGGASGVNWDKKIFYGGNQLSMIFKTQDATLYGSSDNVAGEIGFRAKRVGWAAEPLQMQGGNPIALQVTGTVVKGAAVESEDWNVWLKNDEATYTWPSAGSPPTMSGAAVAAGTGATHVVVTLSAPCESLSDPKRGFTLMIDPTGVDPEAEETILNAYFNDTTHLHLVVAHTFVTGDTATLAYDDTVGSIVKTADGVKLATFTATSVTNSI